MAEVVLNIQTQIADLRKGLDKTQKQLKDLQGQSDKTHKTMQQNTSKTTKVMDNFYQKLVAVFSVTAAIQLTKAIFNVRAEFEKYNAVLTTSLGSARAANREFEKIQRFASETPFSVKELTDSFVRLVNQGFKPTTAQLRRLGDLAASTGKDFIQLTEAIIDAQVGEFERLKEFGIRAQKEGDKVTFTFKEQATQVDFTAESIQNYILSLGDLEGVMGSMAAISETLGGQLSMLHDAWDLFLNSLGERSSGAFKTGLRLLTGMFNMLSDYNDLQEGVTQNSKEFISLFLDSLEGLDAKGKIAEATEEMNHFNEQYQVLNDNITLYADNFSKKEIKSMEAVTVTYNAIRIALSEYIEEQKELIENTTGDEGAITSIESLGKKIKDLKKQRDLLSITDKDAIENINSQIYGIQQLIKSLEDLGKPEKLKALKLGDLKIDDDMIFGAPTQEVFDEFEAQKKEFDDWWNKSEEDRLNADIHRGEQRKVTFEGIAAAMSGGLELIATANKDNAKVQQAVSIAQAVINGAVGITKTGAYWGYPAAIPFQIALGLQTLAQIATIRQQKFARGHFEVLGGDRHAQGGVSIGVGEAEQGEGLAVFSRAATQKYGKFLPAFVKAINENDGEMGYSDGAYNITFNDSKSVNKLEDIRQLLSKPEIRYQGKYRIEIRKGHITKVRI